MRIGGGTKRWTDFASDDLEFQYNPRASSPNPESYDKARLGVNAEGLKWPGRTADVAYGDSPLMDLDLYKPMNGEGPKH